MLGELAGIGAVRLALPRERGARPADPAAPPGPANAALAAAAEGAVPAPGRPSVPAFPIVLETYRECLQDVFDLPALRQLLRRSRRAKSTSSTWRRRQPRRSRRSLLFDYVATYMYEDDTPPAERRAQALSLDRDLLRELLGQEELRDLLDADARRGRRARSCAESRVMQMTCTFILLRRGDLR